MSAPEERFVIVNADDFGLTSGINRGVIQAHEKGIVTSASLMVRQAAAEEAADLARAHPRLSLGLHIDLAEWRWRSGTWEIAYQVADLQDETSVSKECEAQLKRFETLIGRPPTHIDSHQHVHLSEPLRTVLKKHARRLRIPLRSANSTVAYQGDFYGQTSEGEPYPQGISFEVLKTLFEELAPGWTELGCHPGYFQDLDSVYCSEREEELRVLCNGEARDALQSRGIKLRSFADWAEHR